MHAGALLVSVGGTEVRVWDLLGGGRLLRRLSNHQKTVVAVKLSPRAGPDAVAAPRLLTGSLDGHVKVHGLHALLCHGSDELGQNTIALWCSDVDTPA